MRLLFTVLLAFVLSACAGTQQQNQESADQVFGKAKMLSFGVNLTATTYSAGCAILLKDSPVCSPVYREIANAAAASMNNAILKAEEAYAKANTSDEAGKMAIAQAAMAAVMQALADLEKYGIDKAAAAASGDVAIATAR